MIDFTADHLGFVAASYGIVAVVLVAVVVRAVMKARQLKRELSSQGLSDPGQRDDQS